MCSVDTNCLFNVQSVDMWVHTQAAQAIFGCIDVRIQIVS